MKQQKPTYDELLKAIRKAVKALNRYEQPEAKEALMTILRKVRK